MPRVAPGQRKRAYRPKTRTGCHTCKKFDWKSQQPTSPFRHSWVSLDRSTTPDSLIIGEYQETDVKTPIRVIRYPLDYTTRKLATTANVATATWASCINILKMQGGMSWKGKFYFSRSATGAGDLWSWIPGKAAKLARGWFPAGPEDLSYHEARGEWYTLTEHAGDRRIVAYKGMTQ